MKKQPFTIEFSDLKFYPKQKQKRILKTQSLLFSCSQSVLVIEENVRILFPQKVSGKFLQEYNVPLDYYSPPEGYEVYVDNSDHPGGKMHQTNFPL